MRQKQLHIAVPFQALSGLTLFFSGQGAERGRAGAVERVMTVCQIESLMEECALCSWKALKCTCIYYGSFLLMHEYAAMSYQLGNGVCNIHIYSTK